MSISRIASRYAKSFISLAQDQKSGVKVMGDMDTLKAAFENKDLLLLLKSPVVKPYLKNKVINEVLSDKIDKLTMAFLEIIVRKGREVILPEIVNEVIAQFNKLNNITSATLTTAAKLSDGNLQSIKNGLKDIVNTVGEIDFDVSVDPDLLGGFVLEVDNQSYDTSVRTKLSDLKRELQDNTYIKSL